MSDSYSVLKRRFHNIEQQLIESNRKIAEANNTLKQARDFLEAIDDDKLSANHVLNLISTLEECLSQEPTKEKQK
jgi:hypothetical protein